MNKVLHLAIIFFLLISCNKPKEQRWYVQFTINTHHQDSIFFALKDYNCVLVEELTKTEVSSAQVHSYKGKILLLNDTIAFSKQEHKDWNTPIYYFNWDESIEEAKARSTIKQLHESLKHNQLDVTMIDYGFLEELK